MIFLQQSISIRNTSYSHVTFTTWRVNYNKVQQDIQGISQKITMFTSSNNDQQYINLEPYEHINEPISRKCSNQMQHNQTTLLKGTNAV